MSFRIFEIADRFLVLIIIRQCGGLEKIFCFSPKEVKKSFFEIYVWNLINILKITENAVSNSLFYLKGGK